MTKAFGIMLEYVLGVLLIILRAENPDALASGMNAASSV